MPAISNLGTGPSNSPISIMFYTLVVSGERFSFTKEQLESDPDNYFTTYFFGSFSGASDSKKELVIEKEPALFRLIQAHLRGYKILPIPDGYVPYMTKDTLVENLLQEAKFYTLANLVKSIKDFQVTSTPILTQPKYKFRSIGDHPRATVYPRDLNEAEYHCLLSGSGDRCWGEWKDVLAMNGYTVLWSWCDSATIYYCAVLISDE